VNRKERMAHRTRRSLAAVCLVGAALAGTPAGAGPAENFWVEAAETGATGTAHERPESFAALAETLSPAVVNIRVTRALDIGRGAPHEIPATASGFVISADGYIVTNNHVVEEAGDLKVGFLDGTELPGRVVGRDPDTDLALLKVDAAKRLVTAPLGDSTGARVGDWVIAIGNPLGLEHTVTVGIVSAKGRRVNGKYDDYLQTDASINPGNSGGPLIDTRGRVIGINTMIRVYEQGATGIAFAIPINLAKSLLGQLRESGRVTRGYLGIQFQPLNDALARGFRLESTRGALVGDVLPGTPAEKAAIRSGDVIVEFGGQQIDTAQDLPRCVAQIAPGTGVDVVVVRSGKRRTLRAVVTAAPATEEIADAKDEERTPNVSPAGWGFQARQLGTETADRENTPEGSGLVVTEVDPNGPAARAGLQPRDVIVKVNGRDVKNEADLEKILDDEPFPVLQTRRGPKTIYRALERE
jgi:serine protease Do